MSEWKPIDTAPKDGTRILLMARKIPKFINLPDILWVKLGKWGRHYRDGYEDGWREDAIACGFDTSPTRLNATHWMQLEDAWL
jgi:hypothetical protein